MTATTAAVSALNVHKSYEDGAITVLHGAHLYATEGETVALCGPSGCGKSTLLHLLGGLDTPDSGRIVLRGRIVFDNGSVRPRAEFTHMLRHEVGFVFQLHNLIPGLTLEENCLLPAAAAGVPSNEARSRLRELAEQTGLSHRLKQPIQKLSGGERQRTALCRALMNHPRVLLADEPTGALDERNARNVLDLLLTLAQREGVTMIMATHDRVLAAQCARIVEMHDGRVLDAATPHTEAQP